MKTDKKAFNTKTYAIVVFFVVAALLATITAVTFSSRYNGFNPDKVAVAYVESIVNRGDGYNAYKNALISKNYKYGDYIREYYMYPVIYAECDYAPGDDTKDMKGYNDESYMSDKTKNDDGTLAGQVIDKMYPFYVSLIQQNNGWDKYDVIFNKYFKKLVEVRKSIFGDNYMTDEIMFTALEANVASYGDSLTGTEEVIDENTGLKTGEKTVGLYEEKFGDNYKITYEADQVSEYKNVDGYKKSLDEKTLETYKISLDDINAAAAVSVKINVADKTVGGISVNVVKIGNTWYVDNFNAHTEKLYTIVK